MWDGEDRAAPQLCVRFGDGKMKKIFILILILLIPVLTFAQNNDKPTFSLNEVLPSGNEEIEIMKIGYSKRSTELAKKLQIAISEHREWFLEHLKKSKPGEPLIYDPKLGLTEEE